MAPVAVLEQDLTRRVEGGLAQASPPIEAVVGAAVSGARGLVISDRATYQKGMECLVALRAVKKSVTEHFAPWARMADGLHKLVTGSRSVQERQIAEAEAGLLKQIATFENAERVRAAEESRVRAEAAAKAQKELEAVTVARAAEMEKAGDTAGAEAPGGGPPRPPVLHFSSSL